MILLLAALIAIDEAIPPGPFCYPGKSSREVITYDPAHSPLLEEAYQRLVDRLQGELSEAAILEKTLDIIQAELFDLSRCSDRLVAQLILSEGLGAIALETFLEHRIGVCRHMALATTLLVNRLICDEYLAGRALLIREDLPWGRHAWTLVLTPEGAWHLDAFQGVFENGKTPAGFARLCQEYGDGTMKRQRGRWEHSN